MCIALLNNNIKALIYTGHIFISLPNRFVFVNIRAATASGVLQSYRHRISYVTTLYANHRPIDLARIVLRAGLHAIPRCM